MTRNYRQQMEDVTAIKDREIESYMKKIEKEQVCSFYT